MHYLNMRHHVEKLWDTLKALTILERVRHASCSKRVKLRRIIQTLKQIVPISVVFHHRQHNFIDVKQQHKVVEVFDAVKAIVDGQILKSLKIIADRVVKRRRNNKRPQLQQSDFFVVFCNSHQLWMQVRVGKMDFVSAENFQHLEPLDEFYHQFPPFQFEVLRADSESFLDMVFGLNVLNLQIVF